ncbi:MAG: FkbM family methyltransferase [bacterium]|nr:FkbM family methyltransferase [bacterium]
MLVHYKDLRYLVKLWPWVKNPWYVARHRRDRSGEFVVELRNGLRLYLRGACQDFTIFDRIFLRDEYRLGGYEKELRGTVVDLGANVGIFAARVGPYVGRMICYEPMGSNFAQLERNLSGLGNVSLVRAAVGPTSGTARLHYPRNIRISGGYSQFPSARLHEGSMYEEVLQVTLDEVFERHEIESCDLLKIDTEGAEYGILYAASKETLRRVKRVIGEYHYVEQGGTETEVSKLKAYMEARGFEVSVVPKRRLKNHGLFFCYARER